MNRKSWHVRGSQRIQRSLVGFSPIQPKTDRVHGRITASLQIYRARLHAVRSSTRCSMSSTTEHIVDVEGVSTPRPRTSSRPSRRQRMPEVSGRTVEGPGRIGTRWRSPHDLTTVIFVGVRRATSCARSRRSPTSPDSRSPNVDQVTAIWPLSLATTISGARRVHPWTGAAMVTHAL